MTRGVRDQGRAVRTRLIIESVLKRGDRRGWDRAKVVAVLLASLTPSRITYGVVGPCFYCGDDLASSVDHMHPLVEGGADDRRNTVSACWPCNYLKKETPFDEFLWLHPFGSDEARNRAQPRQTMWIRSKPPVLRPDYVPPELEPSDDGVIDLRNPRMKRRKDARNNWGQPRRWDVPA